ncbi:hypothetical protein H072_11075 [Dactylellina haptotyla CBS 200.50]|uniref:Major facilitator superfamily (MFS) profile domain-containing protein n=1 Tax=Dactylellina haptotyla (strain CBS 200.50) TaxID=1284197 RepID=S7ZXQ3_DACHA|nr:hypothetical protein H072_11075 [Dactylellina haptotyla CBS 200.50]
MVEEELNRIEEKLQEEQDITLARKNNPQIKFKSVWGEFFSREANVHRFCICIVVGFMIQLTGNGIISYYLYPMLNAVGVSSHVTASLVNIGLQAFNLFAATLGAWMAQRYGRRPLWLTSAYGMLLSTIGMGVTALTYSGKFHAIGENSSTHGKVMIPLIFIFFGFYSIAFTPLQVGYVEEILPYQLRAKGVALNWTVVFAIGGATRLIALWILVIQFTFPETKGYGDLEDIGRILFDDKRPEKSAFDRDHEWSKEFLSERGPRIGLRISRYTNYKW